MNTPETTTPETTSSESPKLKTPLEFLQSLPGAPTKIKIEELKTQVPGGRLQIVTPNGKDAYVVRGFTGIEMAKFNKDVLANAANPQLEFQLKAVAACIVWTNATTTGHLTAEDLRLATAGLPTTLFTKISELSDFIDPERLDTLSGEL